MKNNASHFFVVTAHLTKLQLNSNADGLLINSDYRPKIAIKMA